MRKNLVAALITLGLGGGAVAAIAAGSALADAPNDKPMVSQMPPAALAQETSPFGAGIQLAQAGPANPPAASGRGPGRAGPPGRAAPRPAPTQAQRDAARAQRCQDGYARAAGSLASLEVRLNLTAAQSAAFTRWRDVQLATAKRAASACVAQPAPQTRGPGTAATPPSPVDRMAREQTMLQQRLTDLQAERPALEALYNGLTPAQRQIFARADMGGPGPGAGGPRGRGPMARGMRGRGPGFSRGPGFGRGFGRGMPGRGPRPGGRGAPPPPPQ